jgi:hypothetical protein
MPSTTEGLDADVGNEAEDEGEYDRANGEQEGEEQQCGDDLASLVSGLPALSLDFVDSLVGGGMPDAKEVADRTVSELMRVEARLDTVREELARIGWDFDFMPDAYRSAQRARLADCDEACEMLETAKTALLQWFKVVNCGRVVELDGEAWSAVVSLAKSTRSFLPVPLVVKAALLHLAEQPDGARVVAEVEQRRLEAHYREYGRARDEQSRNGWPWVQLDGSPWPRRAAVESTEQDESDSAEGVVASTEPQAQ